MESGNYLRASLRYLKDINKSSNSNTKCMFTSHNTEFVSQMRGSSVLETIALPLTFQVDL